MKKTIYIDSILSFGKHKGKAVEQVLKENAGYFLWCVLAGTHKLDPVLEERVAQWSEKNPKEVQQVMWSADKFRKEKGITVETAKLTPGVDMTDYEPVDKGVANTVTADVSFAKSAERPAIWGSW